LRVEILDEDGSAIEATKEYASSHYYSAAFKKANQIQGALTNDRRITETNR
jgi:predicted RNA-binding protein associated with RNAse of E/G family